MEKKINFEQSMKRLDEIINKISSSTTDLDESLKLYNEGKDIILVLTKAIDEAKEKIDEVVQID